MNTYEKQGGGGIRHAKQNLPFRKTDPVGAYPPAPTCPGPVGSFSGTRSGGTLFHKSRVTSRESPFFPSCAIASARPRCQNGFERSINATLGNISARPGV
jgi:hypothetical protein